MARKWIVLALAAVLLVSSAALLNFYPADPVVLPSAVLLPENETDAVAVFAPGTGNLKLTFSETGHFYDEAIVIAIIASVPDAVIHYTVDGSEPTTGSREYLEPLRLGMPVNLDLNVVTLKAIAVYGDTVTRPLVHTYFIGKDVHDRFDTLVFSLSTNNEYLYDYDTGIFMEGRERQQFIDDNPGKKIIPPDPANYNWRGMDGERPIYVETFTRYGERVVAQAAGVRVHGAWSREYEQKSMRLVARSEYEPGAGRFRYDFFPGESILDQYGTPLNRYDTIILRNGANDRHFGMLRHDLGSALARMAGFRVVTPSRAAAVFLNGEYYGFTWVNVRMNEQYLQDVYSAPTADFQVVGRGELWIDTDDQDARDSLEYVNSFCWKDLTNDRVFAEFERLVDVDNLLLYYAFQTYMGNHDWPGGNLRRWRYTGPQEEGLAPELDGRWRYMMYDLDWTLGLYDHPVNPNKPSFQEMMREGDRHSYILSALFKRPDMADRFSLIMCDISSNVVTEQNVRDLIGRLYGEAENEIHMAFAANKYDHWVSLQGVRDNHSNMIKFAAGRAGYMSGALSGHFGYGSEMFTVEVNGGEAVIGTQKGVSSRYFSHLTVPLKPALPKFTVFDHWVVNGEKYYKEEITVSAADAKGGVVTVTLVTKYEPPLLAFADAYGSSARNGCVLINPTEETARVSGYFLTTDPQNPFLWALPDVSVKPDGALELAGKGSSDSGDLHKIRMGFNVRQGRMLYLCDPEGLVLDTVPVR